MRSITGLKFEARYMRWSHTKKYFPVLRRMGSFRVSRAVIFPTATEALAYARRWAEKADGLINKETL